MSDKRVTLSGNPPVDAVDSPAPDMSLKPNGQHPDYWVLSEEERAKGFVRPVRQSYVHSVCGVRTTMGIVLAETYARQPSFYGATFCCGCGTHLPVGEHGDFTWDGTTDKVGT